MERQRKESPPDPSQGAIPSRTPSRGRWRPGALRQGASAVRETRAALQARPAMPAASYTSTGPASRDWGPSHPGSVRAQAEAPSTLDARQGPSAASAAVSSASPIADLIIFPSCAWQPAGRAAETRLALMRRQWSLLATHASDPGRADTRGTTPREPAASPRSPSPSCMCTRAYRPPRQAGYCGCPPAPSSVPPDLGLPVRIGSFLPRHGPAEIELVDVLYADPLMRRTPARYGVPQVPAAVRAQLRRQGIRLRSAGGRSPFLRGRWRDPPAPVLGQPACQVSHLGVTSDGAHQQNRGSPADSPWPAARRSHAQARPSYPECVT